MSDQSKMIPLKKNNPAADTNVTNVISGVDNYVAFEEGKGTSLFTDENVRFARHFY